MKKYKSLAAIFFIAATGQAAADDQAVLSITTTTTTRVSTMTFAQMENIGTDFVRRYGLGGPPTDTSSSAARAAREVSRDNRRGFGDAVATGLGLIASDAVMRRTLEQIEREQATRQ